MNAENKNENGRAKKLSSTLAYFQRVNHSFINFN